MHLPSPANAPATVSSNAQSGWPQRTVKACSRCRSDKIWCNGERPCGSCIQKNELCSDGCDSCRLARAHCIKTNGHPRCVRCTEHGIECSDSPGEASTSKQDRVPILVPCQGCIENNQECDNERPCSHCAAQNVECIQPHPPKPRSTTKPKKKNPCVSCEKDQLDCDEAQPCSDCVARGNECIASVSQKSLRSARTKMACVACRRQKIRCDGSRPCPSCVKKRLPCINSICQPCIDEGKRKCKHRFEDTSSGGSDGVNPVPLQHPGSVPETSTCYSPPPPRTLPRLSMIISDPSSAMFHSNR
ncbi:hypothetical protein C8F01DRAFT_1123452 [Mycena amicta]|nr:hypothetical protein C8F01DRAFT_1123452 [Mycena amicta]